MDPSGPDRTAQLKELHRLTPGLNAIVIAFFLGIWIGSGLITLGMPSYWLKFPGFLMSGIALQALGIVMHEAVHGKLLDHRVLERWIGVFCSTPVFLAHSAYRTYHLPHHRFTRQREDPDEFENVTDRPAFLKVLLIIWMLIGGLFYLFYIPVRAYHMGTIDDRRHIRQEYALMLAVYAAAFWFIPFRILRDVWLIPFLFAVALAQVRGWTEHIFTPGDSRWTSARTITSNRLVSFFMLNLNYHLEHHLYPSVPWYNIPKLQVLLRDDLEREGAPISRSYVRYLWQTFLLFFRRLPKRAKRPGEGYGSHYMPVVPPSYPWRRARGEDLV